MRIKRSLKLHAAMFLYLAPFLLGATGVCAYLTYGQVHAAIIRGFDKKLSATAATTATFFKGEDHDMLMQLGDNAAQRAENTDLYQRYSAPMKRIMRDGGLTYHYTIVLKDQTNITYGVDATDGEDHSFLGTDEENPDEEAQRLWRAFKTGSLSISPIQQFDLWGQLKIANAPIRNGQGKPAALVGADINISVIDKKTRSAFLHVLGAGILSLVFAAMMTWYIARRLSIPLQTLKSCALRIGGGEFEKKTDHFDQPELRELGNNLEMLGQTLQSAHSSTSNPKGSPLAVNLKAALNSVNDPDTVVQMSTEALMERLTILEKFTPFNLISKHELLVIAQASYIVNYRPGSIIAPSGIVPQFVLLVAQGAVLGGDSSTLDGLIGLEVVLFDTPLSDDLCADSVRGARCLHLQKDHVFTMLHECPGILSGLIESQLGGIC